MTNDAMTKEIPMTNDQCPSMAFGRDVRVRSRSLFIGHWSFFGHWTLVIGHSLLLAFLASAADETKTPAPADTNPPVVQTADTNAPAGTNSPEPKATDTNSASVKVTETNSVILTTVDTNSPGFTNTEDSPVIIREARSPARLDLDSFRLIWERNIFNPNRSGRYTRTPPPVRRREPDRRAPVESFALMGTMSYEKGNFAFFEGSGSQYQKVLETSNTIGGYTITEITQAHVKLESTNGQAIELPVGMQMRRQEEGEWTVSERAQASGGYSRSSSSSNSSGPESSEALKRLMERREQEGNADATNTTEAPPVTEQTIEKTDKPEKPEPSSGGGAEEILRRLQQKREQELNR